MKKKSHKIKSQSKRRSFFPEPTLTYILGVAFEQVIKTIVSYIVLWFFRPIWDCIVKKWKSKKQKDTELPVDSIKD